MIRSYHGLLRYQDVIAHKNFVPVITLCDHSLFTPTFLQGGISLGFQRKRGARNTLVKLNVGKTYNLERKQMNIN